MRTLSHTFIVLGCILIFLGGIHKAGVTPATLNHTEGLARPDVNQGRHAIQGLVHPNVTQDVHATRRLLRPGVTYSITIKLFHSGSTWFQSLLDSSKHVTYLREYTKDIRCESSVLRIIRCRGSAESKVTKFFRRNFSTSSVGFTMNPLTFCGEPSCIRSFINHVATSKPTLRIILLERTNIVKMALAGDGYGHIPSQLAFLKQLKFIPDRRPGHATGRLTPSALLNDCTWIIKQYATMFEGLSTLPDSVPFLHVKYEEMQMNASDVFGGVARFLDVPFDFSIANSSVTKLRGHGEDLRARIANFDEVYEYMKKRKPCLLPMLASDRVQVFQRCA